MMWSTWNSGALAAFGVMAFSAGHFGLCAANVVLAIFSLLYARSKRHSGDGEHGNR